MSREHAHGGGSWAFGRCLWAPTRTQDGRRWAYWSAVSEVQPGDVIVHLRGRQPNAQFVGTSIADGPVEITRERPPDPGQWGWSQEFYRRPISDFQPFASPIPLEKVFATRFDALVAYHARNSPKTAQSGKILFFVPQAGSIQCQNGAYLSELDEELAEMLLETGPDIPPTAARGPIDVATSEQLRIVLTRIGQQEFSDNVKKNYSNRCCFPGCAVSGRAFLIGSHIARWADVPELRGNVSNGLALCLLHDRAFERGLFTLATNLTVQLNRNALTANSWASDFLAAGEGQEIRGGDVRPTAAAIERHWERIGYRP